MECDVDRGKPTISISQAAYVLARGTTPTQVSMIVFMGIATLAETLIQYRIGVAPAEMTKTIINDERREFLAHLVSFIREVVLISLVVGLRKYLAEILAGTYRRTLTERLHGKYLTSNRFYNLLLDHDLIDNPDSRITQDVSDFSREVFLVIMRVIQVPAMVIWYSYQIAVYIDIQTVALCIGFDVIALTLTRLAMNPVMRLTYEFQAKQADFRLSHLSLRENAESICFIRGQSATKCKLEDELEDLLNVQAVLADVSVPLKMAMKWFAFFGPIVVYFSIYFYIGRHSEMTDPGELTALAMRSIFSVLMLVYAFTSYFQVNESLAKVCGFAMRIKELWVALEKEDLEAPCGKTGDCVALEGVAIAKPTGEILLDNLTFCVEKGSSLFISGPAGSGKSSIFRVIAGLWTSSAGVVTTPRITDVSQFMVLTETPYLSQGPVIEYFAFPKAVCELSETELRESIAFLKLDRLIRLDMQSWPLGLSPGEKQRIALVRVLVHKPRFLLLDEATCAMPEALEKQFYEKCLKLNISVISIAHNQSLRRFHKYCLDIDDFGNHKLDRTPKFV